MVLAEIPDWTPFFAAEAGAAAALAGLLFVAMSINVKEILAYKWLPARALETVVLLVGCLVIASTALVPGLSDRTLGLLLLVVTGMTWLVPSIVQYRNRADPRGESPTPAWITTVITQVATLPGIVGSVMVMVGNEDGLYLVAFGILGCFVVAVVTAWVLLIEVLR